MKRITTEPVNGMTTNLKRSGHVVELYAYTTPDVILGTYDGWATIGVIPPNEVLFIPDHSVITRVQFANDVSGFLKINTDGAIGIGYTYDKNHTAVDIQKGETIIFDISYISK